MQKPVYNVLYVLPEPSTSFVRPPVLQRVPAALESPTRLIISCRMKSEGQSIAVELHFIKPLANARYSLFAVPDFASVAYDKVVEFPDSDWLLEVKARIKSRPTKIATSDLRHLAVMFDDGPYYEFICRDFAHLRRSEEPESTRPEPRLTNEPEG